MWIISMHHNVLEVQDQFLWFYTKGRYPWFEVGVWESSLLRSSVSGDMAGLPVPQCVHHAGCLIYNTWMHIVVSLYRTLGCRVIHDKELISCLYFPIDVFMCLSRNHLQTSHLVNNSLWLMFSSEAYSLHKKCHAFAAGKCLSPSGLIMYFATTLPVFLIALYTAVEAMFYIAASLELFSMS